MAILSTTVLTDLVQSAYDQAVLFGFLPENRFSQFCEHKEWNRATAPVPGDDIVFTIIAQLTAATTPLSETVDPGPQSMTETQKTLTLEEYGKLITRTSKLKFTSFADIDVAIGRAVGQNMGYTQDLLARAVFDAMTGSDYISYAGGNVYATGVLSLIHI